MTALNGSMMNVPFRSRNPNTAQTALSVEHSSIRNTLFGSHNTVRIADADWIGANYEHKAMRERKYGRFESIDRVRGMHIGLHRPAADGAGFCLQGAG